MIGCRDASALALFIRPDWPRSRDWLSDSRCGTCLDRGWCETRSRSPITISRRMRLPLIIRIYASEIRDRKPTLVVLTSHRELCRSGINDNFARVIGLGNNMDLRWIEVDFASRVESILDIVLDVVEKNFWKIIKHVQGEHYFIISRLYVILKS